MKAGFHPLRIAVLTVSDTRTPETDTSGRLARRRDRGGRPRARRARDRRPTMSKPIRAEVQAWVADPTVDVIITTGGTGFAAATSRRRRSSPLFDKEMDGFSALFHSAASARSACRRSSRGPAPASSTAPSSSACPARPAPAATAGTSHLASARQPHSALLARRDHAAAGGSMRRGSAMSARRPARMVDVSAKADRPRAPRRAASCPWTRRRSTGPAREAPRRDASSAPPSWPARWPPSGPPTSSRFAIRCR